VADLIYLFSLQLVLDQLVPQQHAWSAGVWRTLEKSHVWTMGPTSRSIRVQLLHGMSEHSGRGWKTHCSHLHFRAVSFQTLLGEHRSAAERPA
jgi:hypothetical protein